MCTTGVAGRQRLRTRHGITIEQVPDAWRHHTRVSNTIAHGDVGGKGVPLPGVTGLTVKLTVTG